MTLCLLLGILSVQYAKGQSSIVPKVLTASSARSILAPAFNSWGNSACDKDGNMYFHVGQDYSDAAFVKLSVDGSQNKTFRVADQLPEASKLAFIDFSVTPSGDMYVLGGIRGKPIMQVLLRFDEDGHLSKLSSFGLPCGVVPSNIVASQDTLLLFGYYYFDAPQDLKGKSYFALLDPQSGAVRHELHLTVPGLDIEKLAAGKVASPSFVLGDDSNFYFVGSNQILVIAPDGDLLRRIPFDSPDAKSTVSRLLVSNGLITVVLRRADDHQVHNRYVALLNSGGVVGYYEPSEQLGGWPATCYSPKQGLTFLKVENRQLKLLTVPFP